MAFLCPCFGGGENSVECRFGVALGAEAFDCVAFGIEAFAEAGAGAEAAAFAFAGGSRTMAGACFTS